MKRSEIIKEIVKKSYDARVKALNEVTKDQKFTPGTDDAPSAPSAPSAAAAATAGPSSGAGASGGGGGSRVRAKVFVLLKDFADIKKDEKFLITKEDIRKIKKPGLDQGVFPFKDEAHAVAAKLVDPTFKDAPSGEEVKEAMIPHEKAEIVYDPFPSVREGDNGSVWLFADLLPIEELENGDNAQLKKESPGSEIVTSDLLTFTEVINEEEVYNVVQATKDAPSEASDLIELVNNVEVLNSYS